MPATLTSVIDPAAPLVILVAPGDPYGYLAIDPYCDELWTPRVGPSCVSLLRLIHHLAARHPDRIETTLEELGQRLGLSARGDTNRTARTIDRLRRFGLAVAIAPDQLVVPLRLPALTDRQLDRLPPCLAVRHRALRRDTINA